MVTWQHTDIIINGQPVKAQVPLIVSASRSTDIPAFYADWFFYRLQKGYSTWTNPFNGVKSYVSYKNTRFIVFWSKNPQPLLPFAKRVETFKLLVKQLGKGAVIWRFDPLMLTDDISVDNLLWKVQNIGDQLRDYIEKLVFSYADIAMYRKVKHNLEVSGISYHEWDTEQMEEFADKLSIMNRERGWNFQLATCGEKIDISKYGIQHNRCIDGDLITRLAWEDKELMDFMKIKIEKVPAPTLFGELELPKGAILLPHNHYFISKHKKDQGQRPFCECMVSKDIGEYNTCPHLCEYCYANTTKQLALQNWKQHQENRYLKNVETSHSLE